jgi:broad specificity phosphatase PhoE
VRHIESLRARSRAAVVVSHAEPIRAALLHYRGMALDRFAEIEVAPASVSVLCADGGGITACELNVGVAP